MSPARSPLRKALLAYAVPIDRARRCGFNPEYQAGVMAAAKAIAEEQVPPSEWTSFLLACGLRGD